MTKLKQNQRNHCKMEGDCWQWELMVKDNFSIEEIYKVCRKCSYFKKDIIINE